MKKRDLLSSCIIYQYKKGQNKRKKMDAQILNL